MKRYLPLLVMSFFVIVIITGTTYLIGYAGRQNENSLTTITVYTTLPVEQISVIAQEYEKIANVRVNITPLSEKDLFARLIEESSSPKADLILANRKTLKQARSSALLVPYQSEYTDIIPNMFQDTDGYWVGVWYDPVVFAVNKDYLKSTAKKPAKWSELPQDANQRFGLTDFVAADAAANLLYTLVAANGEDQTLDFLRKLHPQIVQYAKFLATPARMASMGEVDIAISVQSEAMRYVKDGFPVQIIYPEDGTAYLLTGVGLVRGAVHSMAARQFIDWLAQNEVLPVMAEHKFYFMPTNPEVQMYRGFATKNIKLLDHHDMYSPEQQSKILDKWVQVRLGIK
ncbi:ABC transporter substrate-binding protein [Sporomusa acidovorans]|uniref:Iron uptake protein A1 n=1 Tax=Sporomusa acidovorans (strain ATCC 49682 / DSM 3132 / Mol) TaxID=1123286 RepID=A0ABZ3J407_SPOA4|nr:extracellular solute-binding protein [Sporomusa acidovorans]OZC20138.1 iron uptake protein A1 precursor [Sporomusa acidovorans DSM 3132]SDD44039.1 iron(III) transport system substrate-binding protein [Sporomusa acidovorans]